MNKKQRILDATLELIADRGLHNTPVSLISKRSKVSAGTIYHYFKSKEEIINQLYVEVKKRLMATTFAGDREDLPYKQRFLQFWKNSCNYLISNPLQLSFSEQCSTTPLITKEAREKGNSYLKPINEFLIQGIKNGYLRNMEIPLMLFLIAGSFLSTAKLHISGYLKVTEKQLTTAANSCWDGIKSK